MSDSTIPPALKPKRRHRDRPTGAGGGHMRTILALILREMSSRYGRTPGGYIWALLEPLGMIMMLSFGFSLMMRSPSLGNSFILFYATGYLPFNLFLRSSRTIMNSLNYSRNLLKYPAVTWVDTIVARATLNVLTDLLVAYILLAAIFFITDTDAALDFGPILLSFSLAALLAVGVGMVNCAATGFFPLWEKIWSISTRPLFLASGIIWLYGSLPQLAKEVLWWNPLVHIVALARTGFYPTYKPQFISIMFVVIPGLILTALGLLLLRRYHLWILNRT